MEKSFTTFSLLTLNCFGVPSPATRRRLSILAETLNNRVDDVVCLQEVQANVYQRHLIRECSAYPHWAYKPFVHAPKGGLMSFSRHPIDYSHFTLYDERGLWYTPAIADWILHKGILEVHLRVDDTLVIVMNTHLTANYTGDWGRKNAYAKHESAQLKQLAEMINVQPPEALIVVCGDFNIPRGSWMYEEFLHETKMIDPMTGDKQPTFRVPSMLPSRYAHAIDFTFLRLPALPGIQAEANLEFCERVPLSARKHIYLSDHCAVSVRVKWDKTS